MVSRQRAVAPAVRAPWASAGGAQKMVVALVSMAASVIVTSISMVRIIVSATTRGG
jgi:hypothetical protein